MVDKDSTPTSKWTAAQEWVKLFIDSMREVAQASSTNDATQWLKQLLISYDFVASRVNKYYKDFEKDFEEIETLIFSLPSNIIFVNGLAKGNASRAGCYITRQAQEQYNMILVKLHKLQRQFHSCVYKANIILPLEKYQDPRRAAEVTE